MFFPVDVYGVDIYVAEGYWDLDYTVDTEGQADNIELEIQTGLVDGGSHRTKFAHSLQYIGDYTDQEQTATVSWSDDNHSGYALISRSLLLNVKQRLNRLGSFVRRSFRLTYSGDEMVRAEAIEIDVTQGHH